MAVQHNARLFLNSLEAGDIISFYCKAATHWGIYVGNKKVVHLIGKEEDILNDLSDQNEALFTVADKKYTKAYVKEEDFFVVAETFDTYERNLFDHQEGMIPFDPDEIVQLAKVMKGRIYYDATWNSCMKMAIFCRYVTIYDSNESEDEENDDDDGSVDAINADLSYKRGDKTILIQRRQSATGPQSAKILISLKTEVNDITGQMIYILGNILVFNSTRLESEKKYIKGHNEETLRKVKEGDLVKIKRLLYSHWAVYIGNNNVIHLSEPRENEQRTNIMRFIKKISISNVPFIKGIVRQDTFYEVVGKSKAEIKNKDDRFMPKAVDEIIKTAEGKLGETGYNLLWNNCEQFAMQCRYGKKISYQVIAVMVFVAVTIVFITGGLILKYAD